MLLFYVPRMLHGVKTQKNNIVILAAVRTSNFTTFGNDKRQAIL
jgi:hypothetical protein